MQNKNYPLSQLKNIQVLLNEFRKLIFQNSDIIDQIKDPRNLIYLRYKNNEIFFFKVTSPNLTADFRSFFNFNYLPQDENSFNQTSFNNESSIILEHFSIWINLLREYEEVNLDEDEIIENFYQEEFFHDFEILDEDAYTAPFEHEKQVILYNFLTYIETELKRQLTDDPEIKELIAETEEFKDNIQNFSKKVVVKKFSRILAKIKKKALSMIIEILNEGKKEIIKRALTGGLDEIVKYTHHIF